MSGVSLIRDWWPQREVSDLQHYSRPLFSALLLIFDFTSYDIDWGANSALRNKNRPFTPLPVTHVADREALLKSTLEN